MLVNRKLTFKYTWIYDLLLNTEVIAGHGQHSPSRFQEDALRGKLARRGRLQGRQSALTPACARANSTVRAILIARPGRLRQGISKRFRRVAPARGLC